MNRLYSNIDMGDNSPAGAHLEDVLIDIAVQTIECGIFLKQYMSNTGGQPDIFSGASSSSVDGQSLLCQPASQAVSETQKIVSNLSNALRLPGEALESVPTSIFVSAQTSWDPNVKGTDVVCSRYWTMIDFMNGSRVCKVEDPTRASGHGGISRTVST